MADAEQDGMADADRSARQQQSGASSSDAGQNGDRRARILEIQSNEALSAQEKAHAMHVLFNPPRASRRVQQPAREPARGGRRF